MSEDERQWSWWELSAPLEVAVAQRMGLHYPSIEEIGLYLQAHPEVTDYSNWQAYMWPLPDMRIVAEELARLERGRGR